MPTFALISEGITDQIVLEKIIRLAYRNSEFEDDLDVTHLQPTRDATDRSRQADGDFGGWQQVLEHCASAENLYEAIALNDYVIIHIDSDICWHPEINVDPNQDFVTLVEAIEELVLQRINAEIIANHREKFILVVAVHSIECWLIPFFTNAPNERSRVNSCEDKLAMILNRSRIPYSKDGPGYLDLVRKIRRFTDVVAAGAESPSLQKFINALPQPS